MYSNNNSEDKRTNLGRCFLHRKNITRGLLKEKDYKCSGCSHALKYDDNYWRTSVKVQEYLKMKGLEFKESVTKKGHATLITKKIKKEAIICTSDQQN
jgi:hypothetical protein